MKYIDDQHRMSKLVLLKWLSFEENDNLFVKHNGVERASH